MEDAVVHYNISNLKHAWPSINGNSDGSRTTCFDATSIIMDFFAKHILPTSPWEAMAVVGKTQAAVGRLDMVEMEDAFIPM
jgi:hypothetical protein